MATYTVKVHNNSHDVEADTFTVKEGVFLFLKHEPNGPGIAVAAFPVGLVHRILPKE